MGLELFDWILYSFLALFLISILLIKFVKCYKKYCPKCNARLPWFTSSRDKEHVFNAWVCPNCKAIIDGNLKVVDDLDAFNKENEKLNKWLFVLNKARLYFIAFMLLLILLYILTFFILCLLIIYDTYIFM